MEVKDTNGKILYHLQSLTDWHEPADMFLFSDHVPNENEIRELIIKEIGFNRRRDADAIDDFFRCTGVYQVYANTI